MNNENQVNDFKQESLENEKLSQENELQKELLADEEEEDRKYIIIFFIIALLLLIFIVIGFTYSIFDDGIKGPAQPISAQVVFNYSDMDMADENKGIHITNASAMPDSVGKKLMGDKNIFDFSITGKNNSKVKIKYYVVLEEDKTSTLDPSNVKVYLTSIKGNVEEELFSEAPIMTSLKDLKVGNVNYKILYEKVLPVREKFNDEYRLRMWIKEDASDYYSKNYSLKVNVYTEGIGE